MTEHPTPWRVEYNRAYLDWHEKSRPRVVDAVGMTVLHVRQNVNHPGLYDELADKTAHQIVNAVNISANVRATVAALDERILAKAIMEYKSLENQ